MTNTKEAFMARVRGIPANVVVNALNSLTPGINWRRCSKGHMAERWAECVADPERAMRKGDGSLGRVTLDQLEAAVKRELNPSVPRG